MIQLLVSLQQGAELPAAISGGADLIDVKDPTQGSLGRATDQTIVQIRDQLPSHIPLSVALGELAEWDHGGFPADPARIRYIKAGVADWGDQPNWRDDWDQLLRLSPPVWHGKWVGVIYADHHQAHAPHGEEILEFVLERPFCGVLVDTFLKDGRTLFDFCSEETLRRWTERVQSRQKFMALAGSLTLAQIPALLRIRPDIVAIRSAACVDRNRRGELSAAAIREFQLQLNPQRDGTPLSTPVPTAVNC